MRLIDADAFKEAVGKKTALRGLICNLIDKQPTSYDVEKVVAEIEKESVVSDGFLIIHTEEACDIVKRGGVE